MRVLGLSDFICAILVCLVFISGCTDVSEVAMDTVVPNESSSAPASFEPITVTEKPVAPATQVGGIQIDTKPEDSMFLLRCSSGYDQKGETPVAIVDVPIGECKLELSHHNAKDQYYTVDVKGGEVVRVYHEWLINTPPKTPPPAGVPTPSFTWDREIVIGIIEFEPHDLKYERYGELGGKTFLDLINEPSGVSSFQVGPEKVTFHSFYYVDDWFKSEYERITGKKTLRIKVAVQGPFKLGEKPPSEGKYDCEPLKAFFESNARANGVDTARYDVVNYVYFDPSVGYNETNRYDASTFRSCRIVGENITVIDTMPATYFNGVIEAVRKVLHETTHVFGAVDTYDSVKGCLDPEGIPEPGKDPKYPQTKACIMCGCALRNADVSSCWVPLDINRFVICEKEAKDIGWITG